MDRKSTDVPARPFLRWAGSKRKVLSSLKRFVPAEFSRYIEPFAGSACLFFDLAPRRALISDLNAELIDTYLAVRSTPELVGTALGKMPVGKSHFYRIRSLDPHSLCEVERAARFIYLNRFCFNGLYRTNMQGKFNVPYGAPKNYIVPTVDELKRCSSMLKKATIACGDFEKIVARYLRPGDFVYLDPPFFQASQRVFREYNANPFHALDLERLKHLLTRIDESGAAFVVSYASCREAIEVFKGWPCAKIKTVRNISGFTRHRGVAEELIVSNISK